jgi:hypothetical protein
MAAGTNRIKEIMVITEKRLTLSKVSCYEQNAKLVMENLQRILLENSEDMIIQ